MRSAGRCSRRGPTTSGPEWRRSSHGGAFEAVTGKKKEWWLAETVGVLVTAVGAGVAVAVAAACDRVTPEITTIAAGCAGGLAAVDIVYVVRGRISPAYLADAAAQIALLAAHADASRR